MAPGGRVATIKVPETVSCGTSSHTTAVSPASLTARRGRTVRVSSVSSARISGPPKPAAPGARVATWTESRSCIVSGSWVLTVQDTVAAPAPSTAKRTWLMLSWPPATTSTSGVQAGSAPAGVAGATVSTATTRVSVMVFAIRVRVMPRPSR